MTNLKENIWVKGFDSKKSWKLQEDNFAESTSIAIKVGNTANIDIIYSGKTSEIPEEVARECVLIDERISYWGGVDDIFFVNYYAKNNSPTYTAKKSIESAVTKPDGTIYDYIIIFKK